MEVKRDRTFLGINFTYKKDAMACYKHTPVLCKESEDFLKVLFCFWLLFPFLIFLLFYEEFNDVRDQI